MIGALLFGVVVSTLPLDGEWSACCWPTPAEGSVRDLAQIPDMVESLPAKVPGCIELDLVAAGRRSPNASWITMVNAKGPLTK